MLFRSSTPVDLRCQHANPFPFIYFPNSRHVIETKRSADPLAMQRRVTPLQIWYTANELAVKRCIQAGTERKREKERYNMRQVESIYIHDSQGARLSRLGSQFVMRDPWVPCHEPEGRDCWWSVGEGRSWGPTFHRDQEKRESRSRVCLSRRRPSGTMISLRCAWNYT